MTLDLYYGNPNTWKDGLYIEMGPWSSLLWYCSGYWLSTGFLIAHSSPACKSIDINVDQLSYLINIDDVSPFVMYCRRQYDNGFSHVNDI